MIAPPEAPGGPQSALGPAAPTSPPGGPPSAWARPTLPSGLTATPPHMPGLTNSVPVNLSTGGAVLGLSNAMTANTGAGTAISYPAALMGILWHVLFPGPTSRWQHVALLVISVSVGLALALVLGHLDPLEAAYRACGTGAQSWANHLGLKVGGFDALVTGGAPGAPGAVAQPAVTT